MAGQNTKRAVLAAKKFYLICLVIKGEGSRCDGNGGRAEPFHGGQGVQPPAWESPAGDGAERGTDTKCGSFLQGVLSLPPLAGDT